MLTLPQGKKETAKNPGEEIEAHLHGHSHATDFGPKVSSTASSSWAKNPGEEIEAHLVLLVSRNT